MNKKIAITIQNYVQYYSVKPFIDLKKYDIDIYVPDGDKYNLGVKKMHDDIYNYLKENEYRVFRKPKKNITYHILIEPYPMDIYLTFNYKYRIKYKYSANTAKPSLTYNITDSMIYDAILCYSTYEEEVLNNYTKTFLVGRLSYIGFKKQKKTTKKKTILYLPTYGDFNYIEEVIEQLEKLSKKYDIITKEHHGTNYLYSEDSKSKRLQNAISKFYNSSHPLSDLLEKADVVLTDNSGSIFEALYTSVPVCIFSKNMEECDFNNLKSLQHQLVEDDVIPYTDKADNIEKIVEEALTKKYLDKQRKVGKKLFPIDNEDALESFTKVIDLFIDDNDNYLNNRIVLHKEVESYINSLIAAKNNLEVSQNELIANNQLMKQQIDELTETTNILKAKEEELISFKEKLINENKVLLKENEELSKEVEELSNENDKINKNSIILEEQLNDYKKGKLYKISKRIYYVESKITRKK